MKLNMSAMMMPVDSAIKVGYRSHMWRAEKIQNVMNVPAIAVEWKRRQRAHQERA